jgi:serine/threonine-protein kinase
MAPEKRAKETKAKGRATKETTAVTSTLRQIEGKYEILHKIKDGGMGAIYKVRHALLDEIRVIKIIRPQFAADEDLKRRFTREARTAIRLRHPSIAQLYDFSLAPDDTAYMVMEFIDGVTLQEALAHSGPPSLGLTLELAQQTLAALAYLHREGYIHRDISADNLMLTRDFDGEPLIKLIDLGIVKRLGGEGSGTRTGTFLGKAQYSAPEQFSPGGGPTQLDERSDLYSFGLVFYELLTGRFPIDGEDFSQLIAGHLFRPPLDFAESDPEGRVPEALRQIVLRLLAKDPDERIGSAEELSELLEPFQDPHAFFGDEVEQMLTAAAERVAEASPVEPGSTQRHLDERFEKTLTPAPQGTAVLEAAKAADETAAEIDWTADRAGLPGAAPTTPVNPGDATLVEPPTMSESPARGWAAPLLELLSRRRWVVAAGVAAGVVLAVTLLLLLSGRDPETPESPAPAEATPPASAAEPETVAAQPGDTQPAENPPGTAGTAPPEAPTAAPAPPLALEIVSEPPGARVLVDGQPIEGTTPVALELAADARHDLRLELDGFRPTGMVVSEDDLTPEQRRDGRLFFPLEASIPPGWLILDAGYPVRLTVGRQSHGPAAELRVALAPGNYEARISAAEVYLDLSRSVEIISGRELGLPLPPLQNLRITGSPGSCRVEIDGRPVDDCPILDLSIVHGWHRFVFEWPALGKKVEKQVLVSQSTDLVTASADE